MNGYRCLALTPVLLLIPLAAAGCSAHPDQPSQQASCSDINKTPPNRMQSVWTVFPDNATLQSAMQEMDGPGKMDKPARMLNALDDATYLVGSIDDIKGYWTSEESAKILPAINDVNKTDFLVAAARPEQCGE